MRLFPLVLVFSCLSADVVPAKESSNFSLSGSLYGWADSWQARSLGRASHGSILNSSSLPLAGPGWSLVPVVKSRGTNYAVDPLVRLVRLASTGVARRHPGFIVEFVNASASGGGRIEQSHSHQSGRDIDAVFLFQDRKGRPVRIGDMLKVDDKGEAPEGRRFATGPNWTFVQGLLSSREPVVQWIFVSKDLKAMLLEEGRRRKTPREILRRAEVVLHQPSDSQAHDDHYHIRIFCSLQDRLAGCRDYGPERDWKPDMGPALLRAAGDLLRRASKGRTRDRVNALLKLRPLRLPEVQQELEGFLDDPEGDVALTAARNIIRTGGETGADRLAGQLKAEHPHRYGLLGILEGWRTRDVMKACRRLVRAEKIDNGTLSRALRNLGYSARRRDLLLFTEKLEHKSRKVREAATDGLIRLTGYSLPPGARNRSVRSWKSWYKKIRNRSYIDWLRTALEHRRVRLKKKKQARLQALVKATGRKGAVSYHAQLLLSLEAGASLPFVLAPGRAEGYWRRWLSRR